MAVSALFATTSCNDVVLGEAELRQGYLSVCLDRDDEVFTKALSAPDADMAFVINVYKGNELVATVDDHRTLTSQTPLSLPIGKYKVTATYGDNMIGFDKPYYIGETEVTIRTDVVSEAQLVCYLANVMVTVELDKAITDNFPTYQVYVDDGSNSGTVLAYDSALNNIAKVGYIPATGTLKWNLSLKNIDGVTYVTTGTYTDVKARQHYNLKFVLSEETTEGGYAAIKLIIDNNLVKEEFDLELDFSESELPTFASNDGFILTNNMSVIVGDDSKKELTFNAPEGTKSFVLAIDNSTLVKSTDRTFFELVEATQETIDYLAGLGIITQSVSYGATSVKIDITDYIKSLPTGHFNVDATLYDIKGHSASCPMDFSIISDVDAAMVSTVPWAKFVIAKGKYFAAQAPEGLTFMYKKSTDELWTSVPSSSLKIDAATKMFEAEIGGLSASSSYQIKAVSAADQDTEPMTFTTESAESLYNMSFDDWYQDGKVWYPYASGANPTVWDSANKATASFGGSSTTPEESHVVSGKAVRMESKYVVIAFAAGNLYTGQFGSIEGLGAILDWGASFSSRPLALKGHYDYSPVSINRVKSPYEDKKGTMDKCQLMVLLTDWSSQFEINTTTSQFVDIDNDPNIIAYAKYESDQNTNGYKEFVLPLQYRDTTRKPKYIVVVACSSYLGDYFTGGEGSTLYVDEFSFEYDITKLTDEQKALTNYR